MSYIETKIVNTAVIFGIVLFTILVGLYFIKYQPYILTYGKLHDNYVEVYLDDEEIASLNYKLKYNNEIFDYQIVEISKDYVFNDNKLKRNVKILFDFDESKYILALYLEIGREESIWEPFYQKYMKGVV